MKKGYNMRKHTVGGTGHADSHFSQSVESTHKSSTFYRDQVHKTTFNCGQLVPVYIDEVLPGDTHEIDLQFVSRLATPIFPTMDDIELDFYAFFVPNRIVWTGWQRLNGENEQTVWAPPVQPALVPGCTASQNTTIVQVTSRSIGDYYGLPLSYRFGVETAGIHLTNKISALPFRGLVSIWNRWFRDQNFQAPYVLNLGDDDMTELEAGFPNKPLFKVNKKHDYFTSCMPATSKPVISNPDGALRELSWLKGTFVFPTTADGLYKDVAAQATQANTLTTGKQMTFVQALRNAFQLTKLLERDSRGGTRYIEMLKAHFGVHAGDYRLQYPEFLGHMHSTVGMQQVAQTSSTDDISPQGNVAAFSLTIDKQRHVVKKSFVEHGYIHVFAVARQRKTYQDGVERFWFRRDRFDFYYPELAHISEQPVLVREIYAQGNVNDNTANADQRTFGVQEAWSDYKYKPNRVSAQFRTKAPVSLDSWHYADSYTTIPVMSDAFITDNSADNVSRTLAVDKTVSDQIIMDLKIINKTSRLMPVYSIPGLVDHF